MQNPEVASGRQITAGWTSPDLSATRGIGAPLLILMKKLIMVMSLDAGVTRRDAKDLGRGNAKFLWPIACCPSAVKGLDPRHSQRMVLLQPLLQNLQRRLRRPRRRR